MAQKTKSAKPALSYKPYKTLIQTLRKKKKDEVSFYPKMEKISIDEEIARRKRIENEGLRQDIHLKKLTLQMLFVFLGIETFAVFLFAFFQAVRAWNFALEEWSFKLLITATIAQITLMLQIAVKHLFPAKEEKTDNT